MEGKCDTSKFVVGSDKAVGILWSVVPVIKSRITYVGLHTVHFGVCCCDTLSRCEHRDNLQWSLGTALRSTACKHCGSMIQ